jgi:hypothetical protein
VWLVDEGAPIESDLVKAAASKSGRKNNRLKLLSSAANLLSRFRIVEPAVSG